MNDFSNKSQPPPPPRRGVIFDVDGVLIDSYDPHLRSWQRLARESNIAFSEADFAAGFGRTSREIIRGHWPGLCDDRSGEQAVNCLDHRKEALFRELIVAHFPEMPGAAALVLELQAASFALAVGSSGPPENVELVLERLGCRSCFDAVITGRDVTRGKPDPQVFQIASQRLGIPAAHCLVIEDAPAGIEAAHAAEMKAIALLSTGRREDHFERARPELIVHSLEELSAELISAMLEEARAAE